MITDREKKTRAEREVLSLPPFVEKKAHCLPLQVLPHAQQPDAEKKATLLPLFCLRINVSGHASIPLFARLEQAVISVATTQNAS